MFKIIFLSLVLVAGVYFGSSFLSPEGNLISPKTTKVNEQEKIDQRVFEENKEKVKTKEFVWAEGKGEKYFK